jgi:hypothetical protein
MHLQTYLEVLVCELRQHIQVHLLLKERLYMGAYTQGL